MWSNDYMGSQPLNSVCTCTQAEFRPISTDTKQKFYSYFDLGHSPSSAIHHHSINLAIEHEGREKEFEIAHADRSINPLPKTSIICITSGE